MAALLSHAATASTAGLPRHAPCPSAPMPPLCACRDCTNLLLATHGASAPLRTTPALLLPAQPQGRTSDQIQVPGPGAAPTDLPIYRCGPGRGWLWHEGSIRAGLPTTEGCTAGSCPHCTLNSNSIAHHPFVQACRDQPHRLRLRPGREGGLWGTRRRAMFRDACPLACADTFRLLPTLLDCSMCSLFSFIQLLTFASMALRHPIPQFITRTAVKGGVPPDPKCTQSQMDMMEVGGWPPQCCGNATALRPHCLHTACCVIAFDVRQPVLELARHLDARPQSAPSAAWVTALPLPSSPPSPEH